MHHFSHLATWNNNKLTRLQFYFIVNSKKGTLIIQTSISRCICDTRARHRNREASEKLRTGYDPISPLTGPLTKSLYIKLLSSSAFGWIENVSAAEASEEGIPLGVLMCYLICGTHCLVCYFKRAIIFLVGNIMNEKLYLGDAMLWAENGAHCDI